MSLRDAVRERVGRHAGDRRLPVGSVARDRRLLSRALRHVPAGRALVVGPGLAVRQALRRAPVDVAGTSPHAEEVTVCSLVLGAGSLPPARWDLVVVTDPGSDLRRRLDAVRPACRPGARLLLLGRTEDAAPDGLLVTRTLARSGRRVWVAVP